MPINDKYVYWTTMGIIGSSTTIACVTLGWVKPDDADFEYSLVYRKVGAGSYEVYKEDGFGGSGSIVQFALADAAGRFAFHDNVIPNKGKYTYKVTQCGPTVSGVTTESAGTTRAVYVDNPVITSVVAADPTTGSTTVTNSRGVNVTVTANSGANSDSEAIVESVRVTAEDRPTWSLVTQFTRVGFGAASITVPCVLTAGSGTKTILAKSYSLGGDASTEASCSIYLNDPGAESADVPSENMVLAWDFAGDKATAAATNGDTAFPASNVQDPRLGVVWRSLDDDTSSSVKLTFASAQTLRGLLILNTNLYDFASAYAAGDTWTAEVAIWVSGALYQTETIANIVNNNIIPIWFGAAGIANCTSVVINLQFVKSGGGHGSEPDYFEIGRIVAITDQGGFYQPAHNFAPEWKWGVKEVGEVVGNSAARYKANVKEVRTCTVTLEDYTRYEWRKPLSAYRKSGTHTPVVLITQPEILPQWLFFGSGLAINWADSRDAYLVSNGVIYGYFSDKQLEATMRGIGLGSGSFTIEEATE